MCRDALTWNGCDDGSSLYRCRRTPKGTSVKPFRISSQHLVVELFCSRRLSREFLKIKDVLPRLSEAPGAVVIIFHVFVACDDDEWLERLDFMECRHPFVSFLILVCFHKPRMHAVIRCIPSGNQFKRWYVQTCCPRGVREPKRHHNQSFAFQFDTICPEFLGKHKALRELIRETRFPELRHKLRRASLLHHLNRTVRGNKARFREAIQNDAYPKEVIAVPVSRINSCEIFPRGSDPIGLSPALLHRANAIDQHGVSQAVDQCR